jgi:hypothetical protein
MFVTLKGRNVSARAGITSVLSLDPQIVKDIKGSGIHYSSCLLQKYPV